MYFWYLQFSQKKRTKKFDFTTMVWYLKSNCFLLFFGRIEDTKKTFQNYLNFSDDCYVTQIISNSLIVIIFSSYCHPQSLYFLWISNHAIQIYFLELNQHLSHISLTDSFLVIEEKIRCDFTNGLVLLSLTQRALGVGSGDSDCWKT